MNKAEARKNIIDKVERLPSLPDVVTRVLTFVEGENTSIKELGNLISHDHSIAAQLLKVVNSSFYGFKEKVSSIQYATVIMGLREIKSLVMAIAVFKTLNEANSQTSFDREQLWKHSLKSSLVGKILIKKIGVVKPEASLIASLLHDIGKLVLDCFLPSEYETVQEKVRTSGVSIVEAEEEILGFNHADAGGWLCERWGLPSVLVVPIFFHHNVAKANEEYTIITSIVHLADILSNYLEIENNEDNKVRNIQPIAKKSLKLQGDDLEKIIEQLAQEEERVKAFHSYIK